MTEYLFAAAMTVVIVWLVAEAGQNALRPQLRQKKRAAGSRLPRVNC
jgi:hypothetical protein